MCRQCANAFMLLASILLPYAHYVNRKLNTTLALPCVAVPSLALPCQSLTCSAKPSLSKPRPAIRGGWNRTILKTVATCRTLAVPCIAVPCRAQPCRAPPLHARQRRAGPSPSPHLRAPHRIAAPRQSPPCRAPPLRYIPTAQLIATEDGAKRAKPQDTTGIKSLPQVLKGAILILDVFNAEVEIPRQRQHRAFFRIRDTLCQPCHGAMRRNLLIPTGKHNRPIVVTDGNVKRAYRRIAADSQRYRLAVPAEKLSAYRFRVFCYQQTEDIERGHS